MLAKLTEACRVLGDAIGATDPSLLSGVDCAEMVELLARTEKRSAALRVVAAARAASCGAHKNRGFSDPARWLADTAGTTTGEAKAALDTIDGLEQCPHTKEALMAGDLSLIQAREITKTEAAVAGSESKLLELAGRSGVGALKDSARRQRLEAEDPAELHRRQHNERYFRHWVDEHGMSRGSWALPPEVGVPMCNRIDTETDRFIREARRNGGPEPRERVAADALAKLIRRRGEAQCQPRRAGAGM